MVASTAKDFTEQESGKLLSYIRTTGASATCLWCQKPGVEIVESRSRPLLSAQQSKVPTLRWVILECTFCGAGGRHPE